MFFHTHPTFYPDKMHLFGKRKSGQERRYVTAGDLPWSFSSRHKSDSHASFTSQRFSNSKKPWATQPARGTFRIIPFHFRFKFCYTMSWLKRSRGTNLSMRFCVLCFFYHCIHMHWPLNNTTQVWTTQVHLYAHFFNTVSPLYSWVWKPRLQLTVDKR